MNIGTISWAVEVANAASAAEKANKMQQEFSETANQAEQANQAVNNGSSSMGKYSKSASKARGSTSRLKGTLGLLSTAIFFVVGGLANLMGISLSLSGAWATLVSVGGTIWGWLLAIGGYLPSLSAIWGGLTSAVSGFVSWLAAGSAGALAFAGVLGALLGLLGVAVLEWTGVLDVVRNFAQYLGNTLPSLARDGLLMLISIFAGPLAVIGGFITGFVQGTMQGGLVEGIRRGVQQAGQVLDIFSGAWQRVLGGAWSAIQGFLGDLAGVPGQIESLFGSMGDSLSQQVRGAFNATIPNSLDLPSVTIGGGSVAGQDIPSTTIGGGSLDLPQLNTGGFIQEGGLAMLHQGETVVPADVTQNAPSGGGGGAPAASGGVTIEEIIIELGDQSLNLDRLTRSQIRTLAEELAPELGREVENIISP